MSHERRCQFCGDSRVIGHTLAVAVVGAPVFVDRSPDLLPRSERTWVCAVCMEIGQAARLVTVKRREEAT